MPGEPLSPALPPTDSNLKARLCVMMFLQYFVQGCYLPVISVYLQDALGFDESQVGDFGAAIAVGPLVAPFIVGQLVDRHYATEKVLAFCHLAGGVLMVALYFMTEFWPIAILGVLYSTLYVPSMMLTNSLAFHHLKDREREFPLIRLWGTIGFILPAWLVELVFLKGLEGSELNTGRGIVLLMAGIGGVVMAVYSLTLPNTPPAPRNKEDYAPGKVLGLFRQRNFLILVLVSFVIAIVHKYHFVWNSPFLRSLLDQSDIKGAWEGRISSLGQIAEIGVMAILGFSLKGLGFKTTMTLGVLAYALRCLVFAFAISNEIEATDGVIQELVDRRLMQWAMLGVVCIGQALHGFCFGCFLAAAYIYVDRVAPRDVRGSMQNFYGTFVVSFGFFAGGLIGGRLGKLFTTKPGDPTVRDMLGIAGDAGMTAFTKESPSGSVELIRDWPGMWLSGAAIALVALIAFVLFFPKAEPTEDSA